MSELLTNEEAAQFLGISAGTLPIWRCRKKNALRFIKVGRLVRYRRSDLEEWLNLRTQSGAVTPPKRRQRKGGAR